DADGFDVSRTPVDRWIPANPHALAQPLSDEAREVARAIQRTFQMTPNDDSMQVLLDKNLTSATRIASIPRAVFLHRYGAAFTRREDAEFVYRRAQQISSVALNVATDLQLAAAAPAIYGMSAPTLMQTGGGEPVATETSATLTPLEDLVGSLD